ncbi:MAG: hypothetical protein K0R26_514 [Bacteroidota bacterium]|jgi:hypothetical protein|nr:hypothetical protein [Bacteroidota bacterium]
MKTEKHYTGDKIISSGKYGNAFMFAQDQQVQKRRIRRLQWFFIVILILGYVTATLGQSQVTTQTFSTTSEFDPTIKDAVKLGDLPEIIDTVKRIQNIRYGIVSKPLMTKYDVVPIDAAKMKNEPLSKLYHALLKVGLGTYTTPYGEFWINSLRTRDVAYGIHFKHLSSSSHLKDVGYSGFSDNEGEIFGKKFYKKHTLTGELNYKRNVVHFYGYDTSENKLTRDYTRQRYQLFEPVIKVQSHYTDSSKINHSIRFGYHNLTDLYSVSENNVKLNTLFNTFINKERLFVAFDADYYSHKLPNDTFNDVILKLNPYFEAHGKKWTVDIGVGAALDMFSNQSAAKFYFYPQLNAQYDVYESIIIPYAGINGGLQKNSLRSLSSENPFLSPYINYKNSNTKINVFGGLKGNLSSKTSYDAKSSYSIVDSMHFFVVDYTENGTLDNQYKVLYDNTELFNVNGQVKYQLKEKINLVVKGNYYMYKTRNLTRAYHKPEYDLTFSAVYNLKSKIIIKGDVFIIGKQFALTKTSDNFVYKTEPKLMKGVVDANLGVEYRYSKMLSFFVNFNNIANSRYYRWEKYPSQRFNLMAGLTFIPF